MLLLLLLHIPNESNKYRLQHLLQRELHKHPVYGTGHNWWLCFGEPLSLGDCRGRDRPSVLIPA